MAIKTVPSATPLGAREPVLIAFAVAAIVVNFTIILVVERFGDSALVSATLGGCMLGQCFIAIALAGLMGRSWLGAYGLVLGVATLSLSASLCLDWWQTGFDYRDMSEPCAAPLLLLMAAAPSMALRQLGGLRLATPSSVSWSRRTLGIGDIFIAVAFTAATIVFANVGALWSYEDRTDFWGGASMVCLLGFCFGTLIVVPAIWCVFVAESRRSMVLGFGGLLLLPFALCVAIMVLTASESISIEEKKEGLVMWVVASAAAAAVFFPLLLLLHMRGYRLLRVPLAAPDDPPARYRHASRWIVAAIVAIAILVSFYTKPFEESRERQFQFERWVSSLDGLAKKEGEQRWSLDFSGDRVSDEDLKYLRNAPSIVSLVLSGTNITDASLEYIGELTSLNHLDLNNTAVTDRGMNHLRNLPNLLTLSLQNTGVSGTVFAEFKSRGRIVTLNLNGAAVSDEGCEGIGKLKALVELNLNNTSFTDAGLQQLGDLERLQRLDLLHTEFQGSGFAQFNEMPDLAVVELSASRCGDGVSHLVSQAPRLAELHLDGTKVTDALMSTLRGHAAIVTLDLSDTAITDDGLSALRSLPNLHTLDLNRTHVKGSGFRDLTARRLEELRLEAAPISNDSLAHWKRFPRLRSIFLSDAPINDSALSHLAGRWFWQLELAGTQVTAQGLLHAQFDAGVLTIDDQQANDAELAALEAMYESVNVVPQGNEVESE